MIRIREQIEAGGGFKTAAVLKVSASAVALPSTADAKSLTELVQEVANRITETAMLPVHRKPISKSQTDK
jgi:hypothetical protein